jgi:benzylsuccinate CoA-transferase BbsF subunit
MQAAAGAKPPQPRGNRHGTAVPYGVYPASGEDRWIAVAVRDEDGWQALVATLDANELARDPRFVVAEARLTNADALDQEIGRRTSQHEAAALAARLQAAGGAAGQVHDAASVLDDPQLVHRAHWVRLDHPEMGRTLYNAPPFRFANAPIGLRSRAPLLGEHTAEICRDLLGKTDAEIDQLTRSGVLA